MAKETNKHHYDRHPTPEHPMVRYGSFGQPVRGKPASPEFCRDDGTDNLEPIT